MSYREPLPEGCPPAEASEISAPRDVYRLVRNFPPTDKDFRSQRAEKPNRRFRGVTECQARGLSVYANLDASRNAAKLPNLRGRQVCRVRLDKSAGHIQQTGRDPSHHTWWPFAAFDIIGNCSRVSP